MQFLYLIGEERDTILNLIDLFMAAISLSITIKLSIDTPEKLKKYKFVFTVISIFLAIAVAVSAIRFWMTYYYNDSEVVVEESSAAENAILQTGKFVTFGAYEQDCIQSNGKETIEWLVLDIQEDKALLLSRYALDSQPYNTEYGTTTWEDCSLHSWLKDAFLENAFSAEELEIIRLTEVDNSKSQNNKDWDVAGCKNTDDMIFLLSYADTDRYFDNEAARICTPTDYAVSMGADVRTLDDGITDAAWWWLRSPGETSSQASFVNFDGTRYTNAVGNEYLSVRPALWIDLDKYLSYIDTQQ